MFTLSVGQQRFYLTAEGAEALLTKDYLRAVRSRGKRILHWLGGRRPQVLPERVLGKDSLFGFILDGEVYYVPRERFRELGRALRRAVRGASAAFATGTCRHKAQPVPTATTPGPPVGAT
jgi:hypothetical protein